MTQDTKPQPHDPDWVHVANLLDVIHGAASAGPKYTDIVARAEAQLRKHLAENPEAPAVPPEAPVTAPPAALAAVEAPAFVPPTPPAPIVVEPPAPVVGVPDPTTEPVAPPAVPWVNQPTPEAEAAPADAPVVERRV
jgi:hypothetical protein